MLSTPTSVSSRAGRLLPICAVTTKSPAFYFCGYPTRKQASAVCLRCMSPHH
jgi:hypothetical protein